MKIWIGTSGWSYQNWKRTFYPKGLKPSDWLPYYANHFPTVEINATFYRLPTPAMILKWAKVTQEDFVFSIKAWRFITHQKKLVDCHQELKAFFDSIQPLEHKCAVILFQFPASFSKNIERLLTFIKALPNTYKYTFELRDSSWWTEEVYDLLISYNIAFCIFELGDVISPRPITADFVYIRLHGNKKAYWSKYTDEELTEWATWIQIEEKDTYIYFDNTADKGDAIQNGQTLQRMLNL